MRSQRRRTTIVAACLGIVAGQAHAALHSADVVVYGASAPGCVAAIAAARTGASSVLLASPYKHIGGMTTGGLQHADVGNESTIYGITLEFFHRVEARYPPRPPRPPRPPPPPPASRRYGCREGRCIELDEGAGGSSDPACSGACPPLAENEWLAVAKLSKLSNGNRTLTVSLPAGQTSSFVKKGEPLAHNMPSDMSRQVTQGEVLQLARPASPEFDGSYELVELVPTTAGEPSAGGSPVYPMHPGAPVGWLYEAHVAEEVLTEMLTEANVTVVTQLVGLASAVKDGLVLKSVTTESGDTLTGSVWVDGTYEGDLGYIAGATMVWGRESMTQYNESGAGVRPPSITYDVDPHWPDGSVIPHVAAGQPGAVGQADDRIEVYTFRLCMTNSPGHRRLVSEPEGYNASEWEFWRRLYKNGTAAPSSLRDAGLGCLGPVQNNYSDCDGAPCTKCDMLGMKHATDMLNGAWGWPNGTTAERKVIRQAHIDYIQGLLWFWATDPAAGDALHTELANVGYCTDEYLDGEEGDPPFWPYQLYVREARRMVGDFVWTEHDPPTGLMAHSIGLGAYTFDCHWVTMYANGGKIAVEGRVNNGHDGSPAAGVTQVPYVIPYEALLPKRSDLTNVLVSVAASMSHIRQNAVRMEPTWMIMSHAAGTAVAMALRHTIAVQAVDVAELQGLLTNEQRQMIWPCCPPKNAQPAA